jgi:arsenite methyltransferase
MSAIMDFDPETSRRVEAVYTTPDVVQQRRVVREMLELRAGERVLDVGVGPGFLAAEMAAEVGPDGRVCGVDPSGSMLAIARTRSARPGSAPVELRPGDANHLPYPDASFDVATSTQVLEYVEDIPGALAELRRVLRPGGRVLLLDTDWDSVVWHSSDRERMRRILTAWEPHLADPHLPRTLRGSLRRAGFDAAALQVLPLLNVGYQPGTYSGRAGGHRRVRGGPSRGDGRGGRGVGGRPALARGRLLLQPQPLPVPRDQPRLTYHWGSSRRECSRSATVRAAKASSRRCSSSSWVRRPTV